MLIKDFLVSNIVLSIEHIGHLGEVMFGEWREERDCLKEMYTLILLGLHDAVVDAKEDFFFYIA